MNKENAQKLLAVLMRHATSSETTGTGTDVWACCGAPCRTGNGPHEKACNATEAIALLEAKVADHARREQALHDLPIGMIEPAYHLKQYGNVNESEMQQYIETGRIGPSYQLPEPDGQMNYCDLLNNVCVRPPAWNDISMQAAYEAGLRAAPEGYKRPMTEAQDILRARAIATHPQS